MKKSIPDKNGASSGLEVRARTSLRRRAVQSMLTVANRRNWRGTEALTVGRQRIHYSRVDQRTVRNWLSQLAQIAEVTEWDSLVPAFVNREIRQHIPAPTSVSQPLDIPVLAKMDSAEAEVSVSVASSEFVNLLEGPWTIRLHYQFRTALNWCAFQVWMLVDHGYTSKIRQCPTCSDYFVDWPPHGRKPKKYCSERCEERGGKRRRRGQPESDEGFQK